MRGRRITLGMASIVAAAAFAAPVATAAGGGTTGQGYPKATQPPPPPAQVVTGTPVASAPHVAGASHTLPFTGLQLAVFIAIAGVLLVSGLLLRGAGKDRSKS